MTADVVGERHPSGIECIQVVRLCHFDLGSAIAHVWRFTDTHEGDELRLALRYLRDILSYGLPFHPPYKAKVLLDKVIAAEPWLFRRELFADLRCGRISEAVVRIVGVVGVE